MYQMSHSLAVAATLALLVPLVLLIAAARGGLAKLMPYLRGLSLWQRVAVSLLCLLIIGYGGGKPDPQPITSLYQLLTVRKDGKLMDLSGRVASGTVAAAMDAFAIEAAQIASALSNVVEDARGQCDALTNQLAGADYTAAYIALDLPRGTPAATNHNIMAGFERVQQTATNLTAWVWFSEMPATNVAVRVQYSIAEGQWEHLVPVSDSWPDTEAVAGVECIRYLYEIPSSIAGVPLKPQYEIEFGGYEPGEYLTVPAEGVTVQTPEAEYLPYTGWDTYGEGEDALEVRYIGGIAVEAIWQGKSYKAVN